MSVQNGERLVTKQDLSDFYDGIRPYMGGMPEVLANKFSKGDLYSTEERMIGQWIDGKPLYAKTFVLDTPVTISNGKWGNVVSIASLNIDELVEVSQARQPGNNYLFSIFWDKDDTNLKAYAPSNTQNIKRFTIQYTKTTDSAISIGSDTDYSTEEKIIGTWIDGKPLYQKTLVIDSFIADWSTINSYGIDNLESVVYGKGRCKMSDSRIGTWETQEYYRGTGDYLQILYRENGYRIQAKGATITQITLTIQYTKTTD